MSDTLEFKHTTPKGGSRKLYQRNLAAIQKHQYGLYEELVALEHIESKVVGSPKTHDHNIDIGHSLFYQDDAQTYCDKQIKAFQKSPFLLHLPWLSHKIDYPFLNGDFYKRMSRFNEKYKFYKSPALKQYDGGACVIFGLGLGYHIAPLMEQYQARSFIVIEQFIEFLHHALFYRPFYKWYEECQKKHGIFVLIVNQNTENIAEHAYNLVNRQLFGQIDGSVIYRHYQSSFLEVVYNSFYKNLPVINANPGFFEDEIIMINNFYKNGTQKDYKTLLGTNRPLEKTVPIFICGNGPSLDKSMDKLRDIQDKAIIVSCGSAIGPLLKAGINPDFQTELENINRVVGMEYILDMLSEYNKDFSDIHLVASFSIEPDLYDMFDQKSLFFRGSVVPSFLWCDTENEALKNAVPTVGNVGLAMAVYMGFREIYLVGIDMGARADQPHHAKDSLYYTHAKEIVKKGLRMPEKYQIPNRGNLGGTVYSDDIFIYAGMFLSTISQGTQNNKASDLKIYNCSDGLSYANMTPKLMNLVTVDNSPDDKQRMLEEINRELSDNLSKRFYDIDIAKNLIIDNRRMIKGLKYIITKHKKLCHEQSIADYHLLYVDFKKLFTQFFEGGERKRAILAMYNGTILMCYNSLFTIMHRIDKKYHHEIMMAALDQFGHIIEVMEYRSKKIFYRLYETNKKEYN